MLNSVYYNRMTDLQRSIYDKVASAVEGYRESVYIDRASADDVKITVDGYVLEHPESYCCALNLYRFQSMSSASRLLFQYYDVDSVQFDTELEKLMDDISLRLNGKSGDYEKCKAVYDCLVSVAKGADEVECEYYAINPENESEIESFISKYGLSFGAYGVIVQKKGTCMGFALAYKLILNRLGVECACVRAEVQTCQGSVPHVLNVVEVDGERAYVDLTRGFPISGLGMVRYNYFLVTRAEVKSYCTPEGEWDCENSNVNYFSRQNLQFKNLNALRCYLSSVTYRSSNGEIRFKYVGGKVGDDYLERMLGNIANDRCGNEYAIEGFIVENGTGNCRIVRI